MVGRGASEILVTDLDLHSLDLEQFQYGANITSLRLVNPDR